MSRSRIRWIVLLMAVGLLGLVALQSYWIGSALQLQREQFTYKVTDALQEVVRTLERREIWYLTRQRVEARNQQDRLMAIAKKSAAPAETKLANPSLAKPHGTTLNRLARTALPKAGPMHGRTGDFVPAGALVVESDVLHPTVHPLSAEQMLVVEAFYRQQAELTAAGDWQTQIQQQQAFEQWVDNVLASQLSQINQHQDSVAYRKRGRSRAVAAPKRANAPGVKATPVAALSAAAGQHKAEAQSQMIKDVLKGLLLSDRPIEERINRMTLDTLLRQALQERGITIPFAYGVRTKAKPQFLFTSLGAAAGPFETNGYKAVLFPNNLQETGNYIYVYFPTQEQFILSRLAFTFGASAVLLLVILACFYIAISTIVRQKKLADIKNDFINNMTHEFKTPISTISLAVEMAQEGLRSPNNEPTGESAGRLMRYMGIIRDETRRLGSHVEKVLQMALLDRGEIKLNLSAVSVHDVIENVLNTIGLQIEQQGGEVDLDFEADRDVVEADELHLTNIVYNLVDNAIKYSPEPPHITLRTRSLPEGVQITVADRGIGMTNEQVSRIFEKFYRVPTGNRHDVKGFGLGLSYVKKMVDEHHGQITVHSQPGNGSSFEIVIPYLMSERVNE